jgi:N-acetylneuraminic acid mutarotase
MITFSILCSFASSLTITQIPSQGYPTQYPRYSSLLFSSNKLYTFGGSDNNELSNDLHYFDLSTSTWNELFPFNTAIPEPRLNSLSFVYNQNLFIFGGQTNSKMLNDLWKFDISNRKWIQMQTSGQEPLPRVRSCLILMNETVFLYGGQSEVGYESAVYR